MKNIKRMEEENRQGRRTRIKVVEMSGKTVRNSLARNYPWSPQNCGSEDCFLCTTNTNVNWSCRKPVVGYRIICTLCETNGVVAQYQGESGRNLFTRGKEHLREFRGKSSSNCMVIHSRTHHEGSDQFTYKMEATGFFRTPLDRQLDESIRLKFSGADIMLNSGAEWRGVAIPRASFGHTLPQSSTQEERRQGDVGGRGRKRGEDRQRN